MGWTITYDKLFEVEVLHHYFLNRGTTEYDSLSTDEKAKQLGRYAISDFLKFQPDEQTAQQLKNHKLIYRTVPTGLIVGTQTDPDNNKKAFLQPEPGTILRFYVYIQDGHFSNYTSVPLNNKFRKTPGQQHTYLFTNANRTAGHFPSLHQAAPQFDAGLTNAAIVDADPTTFGYLAGDLLSDNVNNPTKIFEALKHTNLNVGDTASWKEINGPHLFYLNRADQIPLYRSIQNVTFTTSDKTAKWSVQTLSGNTIAEKEVETKDNYLTHSVDMRSLSPGRYKMVLQDDTSNLATREEVFYLDEALVTSGAFAVIEIQTDAGTNPFNLFNDQNELNSPKFEMRFRNRYTKWEYKDNPDATPETVSGTENPLPLTKDGRVALTLGVGKPELPNPARQLYKLKNNQFVTEIFINKEMYNITL